MKQISFIIILLVLLGFIRPVSAENWINYNKYADYIDMDSINKSSDGFTYYKIKIYWPDEYSDIYHDEYVFQDDAMNCSNKTSYYKKSDGSWKLHVIEDQVEDFDKLYNIVCKN